MDSRPVRWVSELPFIKEVLREVLPLFIPSQKHDLGQSAGEDSNSSDTEPSDRGDGQHDGTLDGIDNQRSHSFPNAFLGLQGIPGLLPGPSGIGSDFGKSQIPITKFIKNISI